MHLSCNWTWQDYSPFAQHPEPCRKTIKKQATSGLDKQSFFHWSDSKQKCYAAFNIQVQSMHHKTMVKKVWCKVFLNSHPEYKENIQKPDAKSRNSPGQCLGITQDFRTTVDNVASHKVSHKRSWQCSLLLRWEWTDRHSPLDVCLLVLIKKKKEQGRAYSHAADRRRITKTPRCSCPK